MPRPTVMPRPTLTRPTPSRPTGDPPALIATWISLSWISLSRDRRRLRSIQACLDQAADEMEELRRDAELRAAGRDAAWHEGPEGRRCREALRELDELASALRRMTLPEVGALL